MSEVSTTVLDVNDAQGFLITPDDNELKAVTIKNSNGSHLQDLYEALNCRVVDVVRLSDEIDLWVDDEGMLVPEPQPNLLLSYMAITFGWNGPIYGSGVFLSNNPETGETISLTPRQEEIVRNSHRQALVM